MEEVKVEKAKDSTEARKKLHEIVEGLANLADAGNESAIVLLMDFGQLGSIMLSTGGTLTLDQIMVMMQGAPACEDPACEEDHNAQ